MWYLPHAFTIHLTNLSMLFVGSRGQSVPAPGHPHQQRGADSAAPGGPLCEAGAGRTGSLRAAIGSMAGDCLLVVYYVLDICFSCLRAFSKVVCMIEGLLVPLFQKEAIFLL